MRHYTWLFVLLFASEVAAQTITGTILGSVKDPSRSAVAGADVRLIQVSTGTERRAKTVENGEFVFSTLQPGEYTLLAGATGFKTAERKSIMLTASETLAIGDVQLEVGGVSEKVTVVAEAAVVQTASAERSGVLTSSQVENLLIRGRDVLALVQLLPGVVYTDDNDALPSGLNANVMGGRTSTNNIALDGMTMNANGQNSNTTVAVAMDAVAEVKVQLSNYQPEYGRLSGANIQLVTKSGTRQFHGSGSYFKRHEEFNANNFFNNLVGAPKPLYRYNTWSYNVGGPVTIPRLFNRGRDKLFFFWSQEYWPQKSPTALTQLTVPTALERGGDFSQSVDLNKKLIVVKDPTTQQAFPGNRVPANLMNSSGKALLNLFPQPNFTDTTISGGRYNYVFQNANNAPIMLETLKIDYPTTSRDLLSFSLSRQTTRTTGAVGLSTSGANWPQFERTYSSGGLVTVGRYQRIFSPSLVNEFNFGYNKKVGSETYDPDALQANEATHAGFLVAPLYPKANPLNFIPNATFGGVSSPANLQIDTRTPFSDTQYNYNLADNITKTFGRHIFKAGFFMNHALRGATVKTNFNGTFDFASSANNPLNTGFAYANAILGVFNTYTQASARLTDGIHINSFEWFLQDNWKITPRLTLEFGVRFNVMPPMYESDGLMAGFIPSRFNPAKAVRLIRPFLSGTKRVGQDPITGQLYVPALIGAIVPGSGDPSNGMVAAAQDPSYPRGLSDYPGLQYDPRVGLSWDPFGKGKTAVRVGFGVFHNLTDYQLVSALGGQPPLVNTPIVYYSTFAALASSGGFLSPQSVQGLDRHSLVPRVMNMSLSVQQNIGRAIIVDVGYSGSLGRHLLWQRNLGAIPFGTDFNPANADPTNPKVPLSPSYLRPFQGYNDVRISEWASSSNYHSLQATANRRFAHGLQVGAAWTWSKAMDFNNSDTDSVSTLVPVRVWNYGLASFDRTHVFKLHYLWAVPSVPWKSLPARIVLKGWQMSGITSFVSGAPLSVGFSQVTATDITGSPTDGPRIVVKGNPVLPKSEQTFNRFFDTSVFRVPAVGTIGNAAKTLIRGPGVNNWDTSIFKDFAVRERMRLQFRWELYNAFNHTQFSSVDTSARFDAQGNQVNARFGSFTAARRARTMQLALRLYF